MFGRGDASCYMGRVRSTSVLVNKREIEFSVYLSVCLSVCRSICLSMCLGSLNLRDGVVTRFMISFTATYDA